MFFPSHISKLLLKKQKWIKENKKESSDMITSSRSALASNKELRTVIVTDGKKQLTVTRR